MAQSGIWFKYSEAFHGVLGMYMANWCNREIDIQSFQVMRDCRVVGCIIKYSIV